ncbi:MAG: alanine racemase [Methylobacterium sp.]|nr:alanine racemase [Methylobacterium sp.]MCA3606394.1 alanine racemase [Methylobacterium sp.]MCA3608966.1 alanine racemase [Methylobacterium sp.]MCA3618419.1 alanine racemase [Methylobacterium sp.]MCA3621751.1 alanine racemase [Methylobacterium sp.]
MSRLASQAARLTIDLGALADNWRKLHALNAPGAAGAVIKADAYGLGIEKAAPALYKAGCRSFFVAHLSEGIRARAVLPEGEIFVLNGLAAGDLAAYRAHRLAPVLGTVSEITAWKAYRDEEPEAERAALHVDTGMNRLGLRPEAFRDLLAAGEIPWGDIAIVMSHFISSERGNDPVTRRQIGMFGDLAMRIEEARASIPELSRSHQPLRLSLCNSSGHFTSAAGLHALSRPGYALYGGNPTPGRKNPMRAVVRLEAPVIQITPVPAGETVGYNSNFRATRDSLIATLSCGYADGYPRNGGAKPDRAGGYAIIAGRECPFAGNVSMDLITVDITRLPRGSVRIGDFATLIGDGLDIDSVGEAAMTIGYEILTNLGRRYERIDVDQA